jgi:hypothetical protein
LIFFKKKMKFQKVSAQQAGLTAATLLTAGGGGVAGKLRSIFRELRSTDDSDTAMKRKNEAIDFLFSYPVIFKKIFKEDVLQFALREKSHKASLFKACLLLALHDENGFVEAIRHMDPDVRSDFMEELFTSGLLGNPESANSPNGKKVRKAVDRAVLEI